MDAQTNRGAERTFEWSTQPEAAALVWGLVDAFCAESPAARLLGERMRDETGTRFSDWVDFVAPPLGALDRARLVESGFEFSVVDGVELAENRAGMFPTLRLDASTFRLGLKVESVADFLSANGIFGAAIEGEPWSALRMARIAREGATELWVVERHGQSGFTPRSASPNVASAVLRHQEAFGRRRRRFERDADGLDVALQLVQAAVSELGMDRACDLFFAAERDYWMSRNRAGRLQKARQDRLGLGWGNHDHHTYRSGREHFASLVRLLEAIGLHCRERFYAGIDAGWGAQVMEQPACRVMVFADVDLSPEEVSGDFAHATLAPRNALGTVGLWCKLHGEAVLQAGMHHLEAQFDFEAAREQLRREGVPTMEPFTDFPHLRQAFTKGETWPVEPRRVTASLAEGLITEKQSEQFLRGGAIGSHLEILERNDGYKGFNQTGISQIIRRTDPRGEAIGA